jgi:L-lactate dehydrogenase complex protein LldE
MTQRAQLFVTCLAENFFPDVLENLIKILKRLDVQTSFPDEQTCCGQPFFNSGFSNESRKMALKWLKTFGENPDPIVSPSGSCVDMVRHHYPELFPEGSAEHRLAVEVGSRTFEFCEYLVHQLKVIDVGARFPHKVTYHASCHLLRNLGVRDEPKQLIQAVRDIEYVPLNEEDTCCGFGGIFSVVYPEVSRAMMENKLKNIQESGAEYVIACDSGCLMNIGGGLKKNDSPIKARHLIEILASDGGSQ